MEIRQSARGYSGRLVAVAVALLAIVAIALAIALAAWQQAPRSTAGPATQSVPVHTTNSGQHYVEPDAADRSQQLPKPAQSPDNVPTHGLVP